MPTDRGSLPADAIRRWSAEVGHPIEGLTAEDDLTPLPSWAPDAKIISDDGRVSKERVEEAPTSSNAYRLFEESRPDFTFISDITSEPEGSGLTAAIIHMGHDLEMTVVAERVETPEQLQLLQKMQCDEVQGFLFSEEISGDAFSTVLSTEPYASLDAAGLLHNKLTV